MIKKVTGSTPQDSIIDLETFRDNSIGLHSEEQDGVRKFYIDRPVSSSDDFRMEISREDFMKRAITILIKRKNRENYVSPYQKILANSLSSDGHALIPHQGQDHYKDR